jgi:glycosyltransferase involved in cell wall biosynthesis
MMEENSVSIVMPVYNKEKLIGRVVDGMLKNISSNVKEVIFIFDACKDNSQNEVLKQLVNKPDNLDVLFYISDEELYETRACNLGFVNSKCEYSLNIQDDQILNQKNFDQELMRPFKVIPNLLAVSARDAVDCEIKSGRLEFTNVAGKDVNSPKGIFYCRDIVNRGPVLFNNEKLKEIGYLDEAFRPQNQDDTNACLTAYAQRGYVVGSYMVDYISEDSWGGTRNPEKARFWDEVINRHLDMIIERHRNLIEGPKHGFDMVIA